jgi:hypothetical protein
MIVYGNYLIYQAQRARTRAGRRHGDIQAAELAQALRPRGRRWARSSSPCGDLNREGK